jgi:2-amino-4-hydroxy-6-hydroxymethyldihydropteridine diphosphokinase
MKRTFILQGSNEGDSQRFLDLSVRDIEKHIGKIIKKSSTYESEPWGFEAKQWFLNRVIEVETNLEPDKILENLLTIESEYGRKRTDDGKFHSRTLDLDILFVNQLIISSPKLELPHPELHHRLFTLLPLSEIAPNFQHPLFLKSISELLIECSDSSIVRILKNQTLENS